MREIRTSIEIAAPAERVWRILSDQDAYGAWNPFIRSISGDFRPGRRLDVQIAPPGRGATRFQPIVLRVEPNRELRWRGSFGMRGLFDGEHAFLLDPIDAGHTRFRQEESFSGLFVPLIMRGDLLESTRRGFIAMDEALKARAEA